MWSTSPDGRLDTNGCSFTLVKPSLASCEVAVSACSPWTLGSTIFAAPLETTRVTVPSLAMLEPGDGLVLITLPAGTLALDCCCTDACSPACLTWATAVACGSPTRPAGTKEPPPPPCSSRTAAMIAAISTTPPIAHGSQRRPPPPCSVSPVSYPLPSL